MVTPIRIMYPFFGVIFISSFLISKINGFGSDGHQIIAKIAEELFNDLTSNEVSWAMTDEDGTVHELYEVAAIADSWDHYEPNKWTGPCHYYTMAERGKIEYNTPDDCYCSSDKLCIFSCLSNITSNLLNYDIMKCTNAIGKTSSSDWSYGELLCDLAFFIHYMGDIHQPLHISPTGDMGGNTLHVDDKTGYWTSSKTQLHKIFDSQLITRYEVETYPTIQHDRWKSIADDLIKDIKKNKDKYLNDIGFTTQANNINTFLNDLIKYLVPIGELTYERSLTARKIVGETPDKCDISGKPQICKNYDCYGTIENDDFYNWGVDITLESLKYGGIRAATIMNAIFQLRNQTQFPTQKQRQVKTQNVEEPLLKQPSVLMYHNTHHIKSLSHDDHFVAPLLISSTTNQKTYFVLATANEAKIDVTWIEYDSSNNTQSNIGFYDAKDELFRDMSKFRFIDEHGHLLFGPARISNHIAQSALKQNRIGNNKLSGINRYEKEEIENYFELRNEIESEYASIIYPIMGRQDEDLESGLESMNYFVTLLNSLNTMFSDENINYLVNNKWITVADYGIASALLPMYKFVFTDKFRTNFDFTNVTQWYLNVINSDSYIKVLQEQEPELLTTDKTSFKLLETTDNQFANQLIDLTIAAHEDATCDSETCVAGSSVGGATGDRKKRRDTLNLKIGGESVKVDIDVVYQRLVKKIKQERKQLKQQQDSSDSDSDSNEETQVTLKTVEGFDTFVNRNDVSIDFNNVFVVDIDLSKYTLNDFNKWNLAGGTFGGCKYSNEIENVNPEYFIGNDCQSLSNPSDIPFKLFRGFMYTTQELQKVDEIIFEWREEQKINGVDDISGHRMSVHDESILTALLNYKSKFSLVGVMGGHAVKRADPVFYSIAKLARELALRGFVITTGGGPGAMEAANFGAYMAYVAPNDDQLIIFNEAYQLLQVNDSDYEHEYDNYASADAVLEKYGPCDNEDKCLSLGVATWVYGHEPFNRFTRWTAKFFSNAIREDILLAMLDCGNIFVQGAGGTRQEIWQDQCANSYADEINTFARPMIFYKDFWINNGMFNTMLNIATDECNGRIENGEQCLWNTRLFANISDELIINIFENFKTNIVDVFNMYNTSPYKPYDRDYQMSDYYQYMAKTKGENSLHKQEWISKTNNIKTIDNREVKDLRNQYVGYGDNVISITLDRFILIILYQMENFISDYKIDIQRKQSDTGFIGRERASLLMTQSATQLETNNRDKLNELRQEFGATIDQVNVYCDKMTDILDNIQQEDGVTASMLIEEMRNMYVIQHNALNTFVNQINPKNYFESTLFTSDSNNDLILLSINNSLISQESLDEINEETKIKKYFTTISSMFDIARNVNTTLTDDQEIGVTIGYSYLKHGSKMADNYKSVGLPGHRDDYQTYIYVTDPGAGHLSLITRDKTMMDGATIHIEFIDRESIKDKDLIEAYRMPSPVYMAFVRLNVGNSAPTSCYIGRPIFEGYGYNNTFENFYVNQEYKYVNLFEVDSLKTVHYSAGAASSAFDIGICDAKLAIEKMSYLQGIKFMKGVTGNVRRDETKQILAAAFNIFTNISFVDYSTYENNNEYGGVTSNTPAKITKIVSDPFEIARLAINMTKEGGFDKVTWDGASNRVPSLPIIESLGFENVVKLVHEAHSLGLITYISAGMEYYNVPDAVYTGVDGIGIGVSLHYLDEENGNTIGAFNKTSIRACLQQRTDAQNTIRGQGAILLAKLDWQYYEQSLEFKDKINREKLYKAILKNDTSRIEPILNKYNSDHDSKTVTTRSKSVDCVCDSFHDKVCARAKRILEAQNPILKEKFTSNEKFMKFKNKLNKYCKNGNRHAMKRLLSKY